jgi:hypothetical protein
MMNVVSTADSPLHTGWQRKLFRVLLVVNCVLLLLMIGPGSSRSLYRALKQIGIDWIIGGAFQFWFIAATLIATALFARMLCSKPNPTRPKLTRLDVALFLIWWMLVAALCVYGFSMGMGG